MKRLLQILAGMCAIGTVACDHNHVVVDPRAVSVSPSTARVGLGKTIRFTNRGTGTGTTWSVVDRFGHGIISPGGVYQAPYILPAVPTTMVEARVGSQTGSAEVQLLDVPPDSVDCSGHVPSYGEYVYVDELPEAITKVAPAYPENAREAGVEGTVMVQALVCATGLIYSTRVVQSIPMLDQAAVSAIQQWVFLPAKSNGTPVAVWVAIPIRFSLHSPESLSSEVEPVPGHSIVWAPRLLRRSAIR